MDICGFISPFFFKFELHCLSFKLYANKHLSLVVPKSLPEENLITVLGIHERILSSCKVVSLFAFTWTYIDWP